MAPSPTIRRLLRECAELSSSSSNPSPAFYAAPVSDADLHEWHFTLLGPPSPSPYAGGLYHGRITLPTTYPLKPPNFRFLTPSGRFEVNREICLSISGFHEETWMPAWGVRTALTALRTFMAEPGTAGQVGGLESSDEVRRRLAKESKSWKCDSCGKSNESIMREWWESCREKGVKVDEEGEMRLETLPAGMTVEARDPQATKTGKSKEVAEQPKEKDILRSDTNPATSSLSPVKGNNAQTSNHQRQQSLTADHNQFRITPSPTPDTIQAEAEGRLTPSDLERRQDTPHADQIRRIHAPAITDALVAQQQELQPTLTIDRAIAGVFLALCLMLLKKIFYPASTRDFDDFYLQREL